MGESLEIACRLTSPDLARRLDELRSGLLSRVLAVDWLPEGAKFDLPHTDETANDLLDFVRYERQCCPFLDFTVTLPAAGTIAQLTLTSSAPGGAQFVRQTFGPLLPEGPS